MRSQGACPILTLNLTSHDRNVVVVEGGLVICKIGYRDFLFCPKYYNSIFLTLPGSEGIKQHPILITWKKVMGV